MFKKGYMPIDVFTACSLTVAMADYMEAKKDQIADQLASDYSANYLDENLKEDMERAASQIEYILPSLFQQPDLKNEDYAQACKTLSDAVRRYKEDGSSRRRLFRGTLFSKRKRPLEDKPAAAAKEVAKYHFLLHYGKIDYRKLG